MNWHFVFVQLARIDPVERVQIAMPCSLNMFRKLLMLVERVHLYNVARQRSGTNAQLAGDNRVFEPHRSDADR